MIREIEMTNWRAFDQRTFIFKPGLNYIMGPNGKGKTSILEAIAYGLTGETSLFTDRSKILRDPQLPAIVKITIEVQGHLYRIERKQLPGRVGDAAIYDVVNQERLASSPKKVTDKIEELLGITSDFLRRIVYMAEGDVFAFMKDPPGKAMNHQIQRVMGITQLDEFQIALGKAQRNLREIAKELSALSEQMVKLGSTSTNTLDSMLVEIDQKNRAFMDQISDLKVEINRYEVENVALTKLKEMIRRRIDPLLNFLDRMHVSQNIPLIILFEEIEKEAKRARSSLAELENTLARLSGEKDSYQRIFDLISPAMKINEEIACPVCAKPMTHQEQGDVIMKTLAKQRSIEADIKGLLTTIENARVKTMQTTEAVENLREIRNEVVHGRYKFINPEMSLTQIMQKISVKEEDHLHQKLLYDLENLQKVIDDQSVERGELYAIQHGLKRLGYEDQSDLQDALIQIEARQMVLNAATQAAEKTMAEMRNTGLVSVYEQIALVCNNFFQRGKWKIKFNNQGMPVLTTETERDYEFDQFSGGEKTALLIMIHTIIAHHFSKCDFLMVDEPLEHLDPVNRRSLMQFFVSACQNKFFDQALITTYEESLVRKFISEENVNIVHI